MVLVIRLLLIGVLTFEAIFQYFSPEKIHLIIIAVLPAIFWLTFFLVEEKRRKKEPLFNIAYIFIMGAIAALTALDLQVFIRNIIGADFVHSHPVIITAFAFLEEMVKFLLVYLAIRKNKFFDEPIDAMLDMITGAMGFAALENVLFIINAPDIASISIFRFIGAILLHAIASGLIGFYWMRRQTFRGIIIAGLLHTAFNFIVLFSDAGIVAAPLLLVIASFFLFRDFDIIKKS